MISQTLLFLLALCSAAVSMPTKENLYDPAAKGIGHALDNVEMRIQGTRANGLAAMDYAKEADKEPESEPEKEEPNLLAGHAMSGRTRRNGEMEDSMVEATREAVSDPEGVDEQYNSVAAAEMEHALRNGLRAQLSDESVKHDIYRTSEAIGDPTN